MTRVRPRGRRSWRASGLVLCAAWAVLAGVVVGGAHAAAAPTLRLGIADQAIFTNPAPADAALALGRIAGAGGSIVRVGYRWSAIAPAAPPSAAEARDPGWAGYRFERLDAMARASAAAGVQLLPFITHAPTWAEGSGRPAESVAPAGSWRPSAPQFGAFGAALVRRYSGRFPDPLDPSRMLPRIATWQVWNEPNLADELTPSWARSGGRWVPVAAASYRSLLNAFFAAARSVDPQVQVLTAATAPFGDPPGTGRIQPVTFWKALLCGGSPRPRGGCPKVRFDAWAHNPYPIGPPTRKARNADDVSVPDLGKLTPLVRRAVAAGVAVPKAAKPLWITEISWDSAPDPDALSLGEQAAYLSGALFTLQRAGASVVLWFGLRDQAQGVAWNRTYQSGLYGRARAMADDPPKPSLAAFTFPFTAYRVRGVAQLWGVSPADGTVRVEAFVGGAWTPVAQGAARRGGVFLLRLRVGAGLRLRAVVGSAVSPEWVTR